jgi:hypothetical protein
MLLSSARNIHWWRSFTLAKARSDTLCLGAARTTPTTPMTNEEPWRVVWMASEMGSETTGSDSRFLKHRF